MEVVKSHQNTVLLTVLRTLLAATQYPFFFFQNAFSLVAHTLFQTFVHILRGVYFLIMASHRPVDTLKKTIHKTPSLKYQMGEGGKEVTPVCDPGRFPHADLDHEQ